MCMMPAPRKPFTLTRSRQLSEDGVDLARLTAAQRRQIKAQKAAMLDRPPPPALYSAAGVEQEEVPWIFRFRDARGQGGAHNRLELYRRITHMNFRRTSCDGWAVTRLPLFRLIAQWVSTARSSLDLTHLLAKDFDAVIHWARDTETYQSIIKSFVRLDLESVGPPKSHRTGGPRDHDDRRKRSVSEPLRCLDVASRNQRHPSGSRARSCRR